MCFVPLPASGLLSETGPVLSEPFPRRAQGLQPQPWGETGGKEGESAAKKMSGREQMHHPASFSSTVCSWGISMRSLLPRATPGLMGPGGTMNAQPPSGNEKVLGFELSVLGKAPRAPPHQKSRGFEKPIIQHAGFCILVLPREAGLL